MSLRLLIGCEESGTVRPERAYIYTLSDPRTGKIRYVGKTCNLKERLRLHCQRTSAKTHKNFWIRQLLDLGLKPHMTVVAEFDHADQSAWEFSEREWISKLKIQGEDLTNSDTGGGTGRKHSPETIEKLRALNTGKKMSLESRMKMSAVQLGRKLSESHRKNISNGVKKWTRTDREREIRRLRQLGKRHTLETRQKISAGNLGKPKTKDHRMNLSLAALRRKK